VKDLKEVKVDLFKNRKEIRNDFKENRELKQKLFKNKVEIRKDFKENKEIKDNLKENFQSLPVRKFPQRGQQPIERPQE